jgi:hypothetical protein
MPLKGRPRLTAEGYEARLKVYCAKYAVKPTAEGIPPFPTGQRETPQHRAWLGLYKAHGRLVRHAGGADLDERRALLAAHGGRCPLCGQKLVEQVVSPPAPQPLGSTTRKPLK